jgi:hypothetical protein
VVAELLPVQIEQARSVRRFLATHAVEYGGSRWIPCPQAFGVVGVDPLVFLVERDRQRQNLLHGQAVECSHAGTSALAAASDRWAPAGDCVADEFHSSLGTPHVRLVDFVAVNAR